MLKNLLVLLAFFIAVIYAQKPTAFTTTATCSFAQNGGICRAPLSAAIPQGFINDDNVKFELTKVSLRSKDKDVDTYICVTGNKDMSGNMLDVTCPQGSLMVIDAKNTTDNTNKGVKFTRNNFVDFAAKNRFAESLVTRNVADLEATEESNEGTNTVSLIPGSNYIVATLEDDQPLDSTMTITITGNQCKNGIWNGNTCGDEPAQLDSGKKFTIPKNTTWTYFYITDASDGGALNITFSLNDESGASDASSKTELDLYVSNVFYPNGNFPSMGTKDSTDTQINRTVSTYGAAGKWYIGIKNKDTSDARNATVTITKQGCKTGEIYVSGACKPVNSSVLNVITDVNVNVTNSHSIGFQNEGTGVDYWDIHFPNDFVKSGFVRITVASNKTKYNSPDLLVRGSNGQTLYPTEYQYSYNVSTGEFVNQAIFYYNSAGADVWTASVSGKRGNKYVIWAGPNCINDCKDRGTCVCDGGECTTGNFYTLPATTDDSYGQCPCGKKYELMDCSAKADNGDSFDKIYIVLIAIGGAIILAVAIGVPVYCYIQNKQRNKYERV